MYSIGKKFDGCEVTGRNEINTFFMCNCGETFLRYNKYLKEGQKAPRGCKTCVKQLISGAHHTAGDRTMIIRPYTSAEQQMIQDFQHGS